MNLTKLFPLLVFKVAGESMRPSVKNGQFVLVNQWSYLFSSPKKGEVVILKHPQEKRKVIKRISQVLGTGWFLVLGDNLRESQDSRSFGAVKKDSIIGKVITR